MKFWMFFFWVTGFLPVFPTPFEKRKRMTINNSHITKGNQLSHHTLLTSNLSESHSHAPPVGLHDHQLQLFVLCLGFGSKSFNDQMRRDDSTCAEQHGKHGPFLHETSHGNTAGGVLFCVLLVTCHLQPFGLVKQIYGRATRWQ